MIEYTKKIISIDNYDIHYLDNGKRWFNRKGTSEREFPKEFYNLFGIKIFTDWIIPKEWYDKKGKFIRSWDNDKETDRKYIQLLIMNPDLVKLNRYTKNSKDKHDILHGAVSKFNIHDMESFIRNLPRHGFSHLEKQLKYKLTWVLSEWTIKEIKKNLHKANCKYD